MLFPCYFSLPFERPGEVDKCFIDLMTIKLYDKHMVIFSFFGLELQLPPCVEHMIADNILYD